MIKIPLNERELSMLNTLKYAFEMVAGGLLTQESNDDLLSALENEILKVEESYS